MRIRCRGGYDSQFHAGPDATASFSEPRFAFAASGEHAVANPAIAHTAPNKTVRQINSLLLENFLRITVGHSSCFTCSESSGPYSLPFATRNRPQTRIAHSSPTTHALIAVAAASASDNQPNISPARQMSVPAGLPPSRLTAHSPAPVVPALR